MNTLVFATSNEYKLIELISILPNYTVLGLKDVCIFEEIHESGESLEENAFIKAKYLFDKTGMISLSEDTGLEVLSLNGAPGVKTARYAGESRDPNQNMDLLLRNLDQQNDRSAQFRTVIAWVDDHKNLYFEGIVKGKIAFEKSGIGGFGYDPIFIPDGYDLSFADLDQKIKNKVSHRARAAEQLLSYLDTLDL